MDLREPGRKPYDPACTLRAAPRGLSPDALFEFFRAGPLDPPADRLYVSSGTTTQDKDMAMDLLKRIEDASFPVAVHGTSDLQCAAILSAAKLIEARLPEPNDSEIEMGFVLSITALGRAELKRLRYVPQPFDHPEAQDAY